MKALVVDIETVPHLAWVWGIWDQNIPINMIECPGDMICFAAKWLGEKVYFYRGDDMVQSAWNLLDEADVVIHYNGKKFDIPWLNTMFKQAGLLPPSPFKQIDLLSVAKKRFKLPSYKLQYVSTWLGLDGKAETGGFELWKGIMANDPKSWAKMAKYNKQDVVVTEKVYDELLPWIPGHPSHQLYDGVGDACCPTCGGGQLQKRGFAYTSVSKYQQYQCLMCGSYFRDTSRLLGVGKSESVR